MPNKYGRYTTEEAKAVIAKREGYWLAEDDYRGGGEKHFIGFPCSHVNLVKFNNVSGKGQGCGECFFDQGPTYVYVVVSANHEAYKVGVDAVEQKNSRRIYKHGIRGWRLIFKVRFETRREALAVEQMIIDSWREKGFPPAVTNDDLIDDGYSETVGWHVPLFDVVRLAASG